METTFLYILTDPITGAVRYLGKSDNPFKRLKGHLRGEGPSHKKNWIDSLKSRGLVPYMDLLDEVPVSQWQFWEREYIRVFRAIGIPLTNQCDGGENPPSGLGRKQSPETCAKKSASMTGELNQWFGKTGAANPSFGKKRSLEVRAKKRASMTGRKQPPETCAKRSASMSGALNPMFGKTGPASPNFGRKVPGTSSKFSGVTWDSSRNKWAAAVHVSGKIKHLGRFSSEEEAASAVNSFRLTLKK